MAVLENIIAWCNTNNGFVSAVLALITALAAIFIPVHIARKQNKIALFETNLKCYRSLNALKSFYALVSENKTPKENHDPKAESQSPIEAYKGKYLEIHDLLSDEKAMSQIRTSTFWKTTFTRDCINHDREAICSGAFLTKTITSNDAERIGKALHEFVVALFDIGKMTVITEKQEALIKDSAEICKLVDAISKELEVYRLGFISRICNKVKAKHYAIFRNCSRTSG